MLSKAWQVVVVAFTLAGEKIKSFLQDRLLAVERGRLAAEAYTGASNRGQMGTSRIIDIIIGLAVGGLVAAFIIPIALNQLADVDTTNFSSGAESLWNILDVIIVLAVFLIFVALALRRS